MDRGRARVIGKGAIHLGPEIDHIEAPAAAKHRLDQYALTDPRRIDARPYRDDPPAAVSALDAREGERRARPAIIAGIGETA